MDQLMVSIAGLDKLFHINNIHCTGNDYGSGPYTVTFPAGVTTAFFVVPITNDNLLEGNEMFTLALDALVLPRGVIIGRFAEATVTITDSDSKYFCDIILYRYTEENFLI